MGGSRMGGSRMGGSRMAGSRMGGSGMAEIEQPTGDLYLPRIKKSYVQQKWVYPEAMEEYEKLKSQDETKKGFKRLWSKVKSLAPEIVCSLLIILAFWIRLCPSEELCIQCKNCEKGQGCNIYMKVMCKWITHSCRNTVMHSASCFPSIF